MSLSDTSPEARRVQMEIYRKMSPAKKMRLWMNARETGKQIAMAGLRMRNPDATEEHIWHLWARQHLGDELYEAAYGNRSSEEGTGPTDT